ncbi:MAG: hypothetical protein ACLFRB_10325 [Thiohalorhabdus sp.]|uniref:hypothetical protein n=1 Tax=Thiohalorhabdus sp. TaxID=3094134 RepID=UPI00397EF003
MRPARTLSRFLLPALLLAASAAHAGPVAGPSLFGGLAFHDNRFSDSPADRDYASHGVNLGLDYQVPVHGAFSWNPFFSLALETSDDLAEDPSVRNAILGLEGRAWYRTMFVGAHLGLHRQVVDGDRYTREGLGPGWGFSLGVQGPGELYTMGMITRAEGLGVWDGRDVDYTGLRFRIGYRFH